MVTTNKNSKNLLLELTKKRTEEFFKNIGGKLLYVKNSYIKTYSSPDKTILCPNFYIGFNNPYLLGNGDYSREVYPRYRKLRSDWRKFLTESNIQIFKNIAPGFIPLLINGKRKLGKAYPKEKASLVKYIIPIEQIKLKYYKKLKKEFDVKFALKEEKGMLIGPEGGMLRGIDEIGKLLNKIKYFIDIGAGTGELSAYVIKKYGGENIIVNESSPYLKEHLKKYLKEISEKHKAEINFQFFDCQKIRFPLKADLISIGVFYGMQPSFIKKRGREIAKILGNKGVLMIQSSMPETIFNHHVLMGDEKNLKNWPWYSKNLTLPYYFPYYSTHYIDNQFITFASYSSKTIDEIKNCFDKVLTFYRK